jgi:phosphohistidine swiveling domain-containing protein
MNLVDLVKDQLTSQVLGSLGSLIGADESQTRSATSAAVPALLGGLAKLASSQAGAGQLASALGGLDLGALGNLAGILGGSNASRVADQGGSLLSSLFGTSATGKIVETLAGFLGMKPGVARSLLAYLAPVVLGMVAKQFTGGRADAAGLQRLFADQSANIKNALPTGFSLGDFGAVSGGGSRPAPAPSHQPAGGGFPAWLPLVLLPLLALGAWWLMNRDKMAKQDGGVMIEEIRKEGPVTIDRTEVIEREGKKLIDTVAETISIDPKFVEAARLAANSTELFGSLSKILGGVTNEETAKAAIPALEKLGPVLSGVQSEAEKLEGDNKTAFAEFVSKNLGLLRKVIDTAMAIPGVKELLGPVVTPMIETIGKLAG